ncbi:MAG: acyl carrier protein [Candidatus Methylomirabilales bacterium]
MPTPDAVTKDQILEVYPKVAETIADAVGSDLDKVTLTTPLIEDLGAESIDVLDIVFRLERLFKVKIPRGRIVEDARGNLSESEFEQNGYLTDVGLKHLQEYLSEVPIERFGSPMKVRDVPRLFTVETFCKLVVRAQKLSVQPSHGS